MVASLGVRYPICCTPLIAGPLPNPPRGRAPPDTRPETPDPDLDPEVGPEAETEAARTARSPEVRSRLPFAKIYKTQISKCQSSQTFKKVIKL